MKVCIFSDIHADRRRLESILRASESCDQRWCLGDFASGAGADPSGTFDRVMSECQIVLFGNHESFVLDKVWQQMLGSAVMPSWASDAARAFQDLGPERREAISRLPRRIQRPEVELVHGAPSEPTHDFLDSAAAARSALASITAPLLLFGHTHRTAHWNHKGQRLEISLGEQVSLQSPALLNPGPGNRGHWLELDLDDHSACWLRAAL